MTFIKSPLPLRKSRPRQMSNAFNDAQESSESTQAEPEAAPDTQAQTRIIVSKSRLPAKWQPAGAIMRINLLAELGFFAVVWAAYGFIINSVSTPVQRLVSLAFSPWAISLALLIVCLVICRFLASLVLRCTDLQGLVWQAREAEPSAPAVEEEVILDLLFGAKESITKRSRWIVTIFCAISSYLIVSMFY